VMELPPYRMPTVSGIAWHVAGKIGHYLKKAGTVLLAASILIWVIVSFPKPKADPVKYEAVAQKYKAEHVDTTKIRKQLNDLISGRTNLGQIVDEAVRKDSENLKEAILSGKTNIDKAVEQRATDEVNRYTDNVRGENELAYSAAGRIGKLIAPLIAPLGFDWKIGISIVTGFAAKEAVVSTLGVLYKVGKVEAKGENIGLRESLKADKTLNPLVGFVLMLFTLILAPCISSQSTIKAEIGWKWLIFFIIYTTVLAWGLGATIYQIGRMAKWGL
ncbi:MAG: nucleoside recognition domain-containing protein, partial [Pseudomonadota bacterium]